MANEFTFYDYLDNGVNPILEWLNGYGRPGKANLNNTIKHLQAAPPNSGVWKYPYTDRLDGEWNGFSAIRKDGPVQYRLISARHNRLIFLVACAVHKDQKCTATVTPATASERVKRMKLNLEKYGCHHDIS